MVDEIGQHKPTIETLINTAAIVLCTTGTTMAISKDWWGIVLIVVAMSLEFFKYWGRSRKLW